jgi:hypothetical protein
VTVIVATSGELPAASVTLVVRPSSSYAVAVAPSEASSTWRRSLAPVTRPAASRVASEVMSGLPDAVSS